MATRRASRHKQPKTLVIYPEEGEVFEIENGTLPRFGAKLHDTNGDEVIPVSSEQYIIRCKLFEKVGTEKGKVLGHYELDTVHGPDGKLCNLKGGPLIKLNLDEREDIAIIAQLSLKNYTDVDVVEREVIVTRVRKPTKIKLFGKSEFDEEITIEITETLLWTAGAFIDNLTFKLYDEDDKEVIKPNLCQANMTVSWRKSPHVHKFTDDQLAAGKLPRIKAPNVCGQREYYSVSVHDTVSVSSRTTPSTIEFSFYVEAQSGVPGRVSCVVDDNMSNEVMAGEFFENALAVKITDRYGNGVNIPESDLSELKLSCQSNPLEEEGIEKFLDDRGRIGVIIVSGIKFKNPTQGDTPVDVLFKKLKSYVVLKLVPGYPKALAFEFPDFKYNSIENITLVHNDASFMYVNAVDSYNNRTAFEAITVNVGIHRQLELIPESKKAVTDEYGQADFGEITFGVKSACAPKVCPLNMCDGVCYGEFSMKARATYEGEEITSPNVKLHITCDQNKPTKFVVGCINEVSDDNEILGQFFAREKWPLFKVAMQAEDDTQITDMKHSDVVMQSWKADGDCSINEVLATSFEDGHWIFELFGPKVAGIFNIKFVHKLGNIPLVSSDIFKIRLQCGDPATLRPVRSLYEQGKLKFVTNIADVNARMVIDKTEIDVSDAYYNICSPEPRLDGKLNGILRVSMVSRAENITIMPQFDESETPSEFIIENGKAKISRIVLKERTEGVDDNVYAVRLTASLNDFKDAVMSVDIKFVFKNEAEKHDLFVGLKAERAELMSRLEEMNTKKDDLTQVYKEKGDHHQSEFLKKKNMIETWKRAGDKLGALPFDISTEQLIKLKEEKADELKALEEEDKLRAEHNTVVENAPDEPDVLGKICHLAQLEDSRVAFVLGWHLQDDMDTIVTLTVKKAIELNERTAFNQQILPLDSIFRGNFSLDWNAPLPHHKIKAYPFTVTGNPSYVRSLLRYKKDPLNCEVVFWSLLGDTILVDTMDDALKYRAFVVKHMACPTILTRDGRRIHANGKLGGITNQAPSSSQDLKYGVFGLAQIQTIDVIKTSMARLDTLIDVSTEVDSALDAFTKFERDTKDDLLHYNSQLEYIMKDLNNLELKFAEVQKSHAMKLAPTAPKIEPMIKQERSMPNVKIESENGFSEDESDPFEDNDDEEYMDTDNSVKRHADPVEFHENGIKKPKIV